MSSQYAQNTLHSSGDIFLRTKASIIFHTMPSVVKRVLNNPIAAVVIKLLCGFALSCLIFFFLLARIKFDNATVAIAFQWITILSLTLSFVLFLKARCVLSIMLPTMFGKVGTKAAQALFIAYILQGPGASIISNFKQINDGITCNLELAGNVTKARVQLTTEPMKEIARTLGQKAGLYKLAYKIEELFDPLVQEIMGQMDNDDETLAEETTTASPVIFSGAIDEKKRTQRRSFAQILTDSSKIYAKKLRGRCRSIFDRAKKKCVRKFDDTWVKECYSTTGLFFWICPILKHMRFCEQIEFDEYRDRFCGSELEDRLNPINGPSRDLANISLQLMSAFDVRLYYKFNRPSSNVSILSLSALKAKLSVQFKGINIAVSSSIQITQALFLLFISLGFKNCYSYTKQFLTVIDFDNCYFTNYFYKHTLFKIESRRKKAHRTSLMPFRKVEVKGRIKSMSVALRKSDIGKMGSGLGRVIGLGVLLALLAYFDNLIYSLIKLMEDHQEVEVSQTGHSQYSLEITEGKGPLANKLRDILLTFKTSNTTISQQLNNHACAMRPQMAKTDAYISIGLCGLWLTICGLLCPYTLRMQHIIAARSLFVAVVCSIHRLRAKARSVALYNKILTERATFVLFGKQKLLQKYKNAPDEFGEKLGLAEIACKKWPDKAKWLGRFIKVRCGLCEAKLKMKESRCCRVESTCRHYFCVTCWRFLDRQCPACEIRDGRFDGIQEELPEDGDDSFTETEEEQAEEEQK